MLSSKSCVHHFDDSTLAKFASFRQSERQSTSEILGSNFTRVPQNLPAVCSLFMQNSVDMRTGGISTMGKLGEKIPVWPLSSSEGPVASRLPRSHSWCCHRSDSRRSPEFREAKREQLNGNENELSHLITTVRVLFIRTTIGTTVRTWKLVPPYFVIRKQSFSGRSRTRGLCFR